MYDYEQNNQAPNLIMVQPNNKVRNVLVIGTSVGLLLGLSISVGCNANPGFIAMWTILGAGVGFGATFGVIAIAERS